MIEEDGTGLANADTYVDPTGTFAVNYVAAHLYADAWTAASAPRRVAAVQQASRTLDGLYCWRGKRLTGTQALDWPRDCVTVDGFAVVGVPVTLKMATVELAMALLERNRTSDTSSGSAPVESIGLGDGALEIKFGADPTASATPAEDMIPPYITLLLRKLGHSAQEKRTGGMVRIERR